MKIIKVANFKRESMPMIKEDQLPDGYGCWVSPTGEEISVNQFEHSKVATRILEEKKLLRNKNASLYELQFLGYVRIIHTFNFQLQTETKLTDTQKSVISKIMRSKDFNSYTFQSPIVKISSTVNDILSATNILLNI